MVAKITFPKRLVSALNYNEKKVEKGTARCIWAGNFLGAASQLTRDQKQRCFERRNELNDRAQTKTVHISLNFPPGENISQNGLVAIAQKYMEGIGFGEQPYLVYQHQDAGHPHIHIVTSTIRNDGSRLNTHNLGRNASSKVRQDIESQFGLKKATADKNYQPTTPQKLLYGEMETKKSIANVVEHVFSNYHFTSLAAYNAALRSFNVYADPGTQGGRLAHLGGLHYHALDKEGQKVGVPIKGSDLPGKPTLKNLELRFIANKGEETYLKGQVTGRVEESLIQPPNTWEDWLKGLEALGITALVHKSNDGRPYGITFVDHEVRAVFKGSDLGRHLSVGAIMTLFRHQEMLTEKINLPSGREQKEAVWSKRKEELLSNSGANPKLEGEGIGLPYPLLNSEPPPLLLRKKRKRKKKNNH
jgi:hypothetical protein